MLPQHPVSDLGQARNSHQHHMHYKPLSGIGVKKKNNLACLIHPWQAATIISKQASSMARRRWTTIHEKRVWPHFQRFFNKEIKKYSKWQLWNTYFAIQKVGHHIVCTTADCDITVLKYLKNRTCTRFKCWSLTRNTLGLFHPQPVLSKNAVSKIVEMLTVMMPWNFPWFSITLLCISCKRMILLAMTMLIICLSCSTENSCLLPPSGGCLSFLQK